MILRDRHCTFPNCDRPAPWCDVHHIQHWADGGETSLANSTLQCRQHHGSLHPPGGFRLTKEDGRLVFRRPDGSMLVDERALVQDRAPVDDRAPADDRGPP
jgi:HNH endonuclease